MADGTQTSVRNMALVRNKNNVTEQMLAKQIRDFDREQSIVLLSIDHDRLDMKDFLRQIRICESDELPEAKHWLGRKNRRENSDLEAIRDVVKAPSFSSRKTDERKDQEAADLSARVDDGKVKDLSSSGIFRTRDNVDVAKKLTLYNIYSRRAELVDAGPAWETSPPEGPTTEQEQAKGLVTFNVAGDASDNQRDDRAETSAKAQEDEQTDGSPDGKEAKHVRGTDNDKDRRRRHQQADGDFMKELLVSNAKRRYRRKKVKPIKERLIDFYTKLEDLKQKEADDAPNARQIRRRYVLLTQGVKAALDMSSDEDEGKG